MREKPDAVNKTVAVFLWTYCIGFVAVYLSVPNPLVFQVNIYDFLLKVHHTNDPFLWSGSVRDSCVCHDWSSRVHHQDPEQPAGDVPVHGQCALLLGRLHTLELG